MAIQKNKVPIALNTPLDTKSDQYLTPGFSLLQNVRHKKTGGLIKRNGYTKLTKEVANTSSGTFSETIDGAIALKSYKNELVLLAEQGVFSYSNTNSPTAVANSWLSRDFVNNTTTIGSPVVRKDSSATSCTSLSTPVITDPNYYNAPKYIETTDFKIYVAQSDVATSILRIVDISTGATIIERQFAISQPNIATDSTYLYLTGRSTNAFVYYPIPLTTLNYSISAVTIAALNWSTASTSAYDIVSHSGFAFLTAAAATGGQYYMKAYTLVNTTATNTATVSLGPDYTANGPLEVRVCKYQSVFRSVHNNNFLGAWTLTFIEYTASGTSVGTLNTISDGALATDCSICADSTNTYIIYTRATLVMGMATVNSGGSVTLTQFYAYGLVQSNPVVYDGHIYVAVRGPLTNLGSYVIIQKNLSKSTQAALFAKSLEFINRPLSILDSVTPNLRSGLPRLINSGTKISGVGIGFVEVIKPAYETTPNAPANQHVMGLEFDFNTSYMSVSVSSGLIVSGSITKLYDGKNYTELGFIESPAIFNETTTGAAATFAAGTYGIATVFAWTDNNGLLHRSAPGFATVTNAGTFTSIDYTGTNLILTEKEGVIIEEYLTEANGTTYYFVNQKDNNRATTTYSSTFAAPVTDFTNVLYTTSGELENDAPNSNLGIAYFKNRVFTISKNSLQYSKPIEPNAPIEFNGDQVISLEAEGGDATGIYGMDNSLIIFKQNAIYLLSGEGPNVLGQQNDYGNPQLITTDTGNIDLNSIVAYKNGILFKSDKGIYELNRGLASQYIGAPVEAYNSYSISSATLLSEVNEIRFVLSNGQILTFDYQERQWVIDTVTNVISGISHNNTYYYVNSSTEVEVENALYWDNYDPLLTVVPYSMKLVTNWIQAVATNAGVSMYAGVQQWQRIYRIHLLGKYKSTHTLKVSLSYNYSDTVIDFATITPSGSGLYEFIVNPSVQKCEAIKITVEDTNTSVVNGESVELSSILLELGTKNTAQKQVGDSGKFAAT